MFIDSTLPSVAVVVLSTISIKVTIDKATKFEDYSSNILDIFFIQYFTILIAKLTTCMWSLV